MAEHVAIIGAGFSGTMFAVNWVRQGGARATLIGARNEPGRGLAYGAAHPAHLLNVPAAKMSAFPDQPDHFVRWLHSRGHPEAGSVFAPRLLFGAYIRDILDTAVADAGGRLEIVGGTVGDLRPSGPGMEAVLADGRHIAADAVVLAMGNAPPQTPRNINAGRLPPGTYVGDPWAPGATEGLAHDDRVLIIGTGLTMVDVALRLQEEGFTGPILAVSRRGLIPRAHAAGAPTPRNDLPPTRLTALLREVRGRVGELGWRGAIDELRPVTQDLWRAADPATRERFLRHLRPWWDVHRHRIAPEVSDRLRGMIDAGQLRVAAGKLADVAPDPAGAVVTWRPRFADAAEQVRVSRIVNCTGPEANLRNTADPLLHRLLAAGLIRPDPLGIGVDVDEGSRVFTEDGSPSPNLFALGPLTRGAFWEIVAVPDIRKQAWQLARDLAVR